MRYVASGIVLALLARPERIGPLLDIEQNKSPSFCKFRDGLRHLTA